MREFKKNDRVISCDYGEGTVMKILKNDPQPVCVLFDDVIGKRETDKASYLYYTLDGRSNVIGAGYHWNGVFHPYDDSQSLTHLDDPL